ncbi:kelch-like protein 24a isoform X2 [Branchiostoma lanceolatum]
MDNNQPVDDSQTTEVSGTVDDSQTTEVSEAVDDNETVLVEDNEAVDNSYECDDTDEYPAWFLERLQEFRTDGHLVDVTLCAEGKEIPCHRLVLSAFAEYFHAMFSGAHSESKKNKIEIGGVSAEALEQLVDIAYTSRFTITIDNVQPLYEAANMLQVEHVEDRCEQFLTDRLRPDTCLGTWVLADKVSNTNLSAIAKSFALKFFEQVCVTDDFLNLPVDFLKTYISDNDLHAKKEEKVLELIMIWARHDLQERQTHLKDLLECVRISQVDQDHLKNIMETDKVLAGVSGIKELIKDQSVQARSCNVFQGEILLLGGVTEGKDRQDSEPNCCMYRLDVQCCCVDNTSLPQSLHNSAGTAACVVNDDVIVTGGRKSLSQAWRYRSSLNSWTKLGSLRTERYDHGMAVLQGKVYVVGGVKDEIRFSDPNFPFLTHLHELFRRETEVYNEVTDSWELVAPLQQKVCEFGITTCCENIYVFGGRAGRSERTAAVQCYNPTLNVWNFATPMLHLTRDVIACTINSKVYLVGGNLDHVLCYDPQEDFYEEMAKPVLPWELSGATVCGSEIFITGGNCDEDYGEPCSCKAQCYNVNSNTVIRVLDLPIPLSRHISVTIPKL